MPTSKAARRRGAALELWTERARLHLPAPAEARHVLEYFQCNQEHLAPWSPPLPADFLTETYWQRRLAENRAEYEADRSLRMFLRTPAGGPDAPVIGSLSFTELVRGPFQACLLGYGIDAEHQGRGIMHAALARACRHVFEVLGLRRIQANHMPENDRSARLLGRLGFQVEGHARDYLFIDGAWRDHVLTSLTNNDAPTPG